MKIKEIKISNFKSFEKVSIKLDNLNVLIGANASGKSNFVNVLKFLNDIQVYGIDDAISLQGGMQYLYNSEVTSDKPVKIETHFYNDISLEKNISKKFFNDVQLFVTDFVHKIEIFPMKKSDRYKKVVEHISLNCDLLLKDEKTTKVKVNILSDDFKTSHTILNDHINDEVKKKIEKFILWSFIDAEDKSILNTLRFFGFSFVFSKSTMKFYDFNVNLLKSPSSIATTLDLKEDGSNLVNLLQKLLKNKDNKTRFSRHVKSVLPFISEIKIENSINKSLIFKIKEKYSKKEYPSNLLSDGTVNVIALIIALYFQNEDDIIIIEEPEKNIHPQLLSRVANMLKDVSRNKQVIITTHSPYILTNIQLNDILTIKRSKKGFSVINKPSNSNKITKFLDNELGIDQLFVDGILND